MNWYYQNSSDNNLRFVLGAQEAEFLTKKSIICIGVNPSTATPEKPDATIRNVIKLVQNNGYQNFYMMNLYPQRARDINAMDASIDLSKHEDNLTWFKHLIRSYTELHSKGFDIWCAWGNLIEHRKYLREICLKDIYGIAKESGCHFYSIGQISKTGNPHHPLYVKADTIKEEYDPAHYFINHAKI